MLGSPRFWFWRLTMSLAGRGIVTIWHDIVPEGQPDFYEWHNREHMPERMGIPGFRRGRRYIAGEGGFIATLRFGASNKSEDQLFETVLPQIGKERGVVGVHFCAADGSASNIPTREKTFRTSTDICPPYTIMIEGSSARSVKSAAARLLNDLSADLGVYQLENTRSNLYGAYNGAGVYNDAKATSV